MQITAFTETFNLKHNTIVLGISSYYPQKIHVRNTLKMPKTLGLQGVSPPDPHKGALPPGPPPGAPPLDTPHKLKWNDAPEYIVGPRSMSKSNMQVEDIFWNSIPDTRAQAAGSSSYGSYIAACSVNLGNKSVLLREGAYPILTGNVTWRL